MYITLHGKVMSSL